MRRTSAREEASRRRATGVRSDSTCLRSTGSSSRGSCGIRRSNSQSATEPSGPACGRGVAPSTSVGGRRIRVCIEAFVEVPVELVLWELHLAAEHGGEQGGQLVDVGDIPGEGG